MNKVETQKSSYPMQPGSNAPVGLVDPNRSSVYLLLAASVLFLIVGSYHAYQNFTHLRTPLYIDGKFADYSVPRNDWGMMDFQDTAYYPVLAFLNGDNPYDATRYREKYAASQYFPLYSPLTLLVHIPFALLPFWWANALYFGLSVFCLVMIGRFTAGLLGVSLVWEWTFLLATFLALTRPGHLTLAGGQIIGEVSLACLIAIHFARNRPLIAGCALALSTMKPTLGVLLFALMVCRLDLRAIAHAAWLTAVLTSIPIAVLIYNAGGMVPLLEIIPQNIEAFRSHPNVSLQTTTFRIDLPMFIRYWTGWDMKGTTELAIGVLLCMLSALALFWLGRSNRSTTVDSCSGVLMGLTMMLCVYHSLYDALFLFPAMVGMLWWSPRPNLEGSRRWRQTIGVLLAIPFWNPFMLNGFRRLLGLSSESIAFGIAMNPTVFVFAYCILLFTAWRFWARNRDRSIVASSA